ncbi:MAG: FtsW/RodA/SpoVE family cell cycle protein, partial [Ardenticatenia bacterium]|nr:FtsW/RodA/SpoVE family cell cycle protein [Ardenticatenia bacterium]
MSFPLAFLAVGFWLLRQLDVPTASGHWWPVVVVAAALMAAHVVLGARCPRRDPVLLPLVTMLNAVGLVMIERLASNFTARQVMAMVVGLGVAVGVATWPHALFTLRRVRYSLILPGILVLLITVLIGLSPLGGGQSMFLRIGPIGFQPSEPLKLLLIIFLASYLDQHHEKFRAIRLGRLWRERRWLWVYFPMLSMWGFAMVLLVLQRDLGAALLFFGIFLSMTYLATARRDYALIGLGLFALGASAAVQLFAHVRARLLIWRNPWPEADERAFQVVQALLAVAAGGVLGQAR